MSFTDNRGTMRFTDNRQGRHELPVVIKDSRGSMSYTDNRQGRYELQGQSGQAWTLYELHRQQGHCKLSAVFTDSKDTTSFQSSSQTA